MGLIYLYILKCAVEAQQARSEAYSDAAPSYPNRQFQFQRLKDGDFDVNDKKRPGEPKKIENNESKTYCLDV
uniref:Uncharacterized protein n=1 Tax=Glossina morsitans morsitans TaxID=37546 RepID=A0ABK9NG29_GLOMM